MTSIPPTVACPAAQFEIATTTLKVACVYASEDALFARQLIQHLAVLKKRQLIDLDDDVLPGDELGLVMISKIREADITLALTSRALLVAHWFDAAVQAALDQREGRRRIVPILIRPALWNFTSLEPLQALPRNGRPIVSWRIRDEGWLAVVFGLLGILESLKVYSTNVIAGIGGHAPACEKAWPTFRLVDLPGEGRG